MDVVKSIQCFSIWFHPDLALTYLYERPLKDGNLVNNSEGGEGLEDETGRICRKLVSGQPGCL